MNRQAEDASGYNKAGSGGFNAFGFFAVMRRRWKTVLAGIVGGLLLGLVLIWVQISEWNKMVHVGLLGLSSSAAKMVAAEPSADVKVALLELEQQYREILPKSIADFASPLLEQAWAEKQLQAYLLPGGATLTVRLASHPKIPQSLNSEAVLDMFQTSRPSEIESIVEIRLGGVDYSQFNTIQQILMDGIEEVRQRENRLRPQRIVAAAGRTQRYEALLQQKKAPLEKQIAEHASFAKDTSSCIANIAEELKSFEGALDLLQPYPSSAAEVAVKLQSLIKKREADSAALQTRLSTRENDARSLVGKIAFLEGVWDEIKKDEERISVLPEWERSPLMLVQAPSSITQPRRRIFMTVASMLALGALVGCLLAVLLDSIARRKANRRSL